MSNLLKTVSTKAGKEIGKQLGKAGKAIDDFLTPKSLTEKQKSQTRRTRRKLKEKEDPLKSFAGSKDPAIKKARQEAIDKARAQAKKTRGAQKRRQQKEKDAAVSKRKKQIGGAGAGTAAVIGLTTLGSNDKPKPKSKTLKTTDQMKKDRQAVSDIAKFSAKKNQEKLDKEKRRKEDAAKDLTWKDFSGRGALKRAKEYGLKHYMGADGKKKATIDKSEIREGETMTQAFNRILGKTPRKKNMGGMMKSKGMAKGGAMKKKGYAIGGVAKKPVPPENKGLKKLPKDVRNKMGYMKNGGMAKKGYSKGGAVKSAKKKRSTGAALRGFGAEIR
tara:strand:- start:550 stop:1542 length:993 start_codon:yes stop_codon:yes gene_type:complete